MPSFPEGKMNLSPIFTQSRKDAKKELTIQAPAFLGALCGLARDALDFNSLFFDFIGLRRSLVKM